jgi:hypothetical protein
MKSFKDMLSETVDKPRSPDEQNFLDKHIIDKRDHSVAPDDQFSGAIKGSKRKKRVADLEDGEDKEVYESSESEMTPEQEKKREEIVMSLKKKMSEFKDRYGDKAKDVMYATATKMAMKEGMYSKKMKDGMHRMPDGTMMKDSEHAKVKEGMYSKKMKEGISESVIDDMKDIVASKSIKDVKFSDGKKRKVDMTTASKIVSMHKQLNKENQAKVERMLNDSNKFMQIVQFAMNIGK